MVLVCENCGKPATHLKATGHGDVAVCDKCTPGDWTGEARSLVETLPDLSGRKAVSKREAAAMLGKSVDYLEQHVMPELLVIRKGSAVLIPVDELEAWMAASKARALKDR